jgi:hypothetical protein
MGTCLARIIDYSHPLRTGSYEIAEAEGVARGTKIVISLNNESKMFSEPQEIEGLQFQ